MTWRFFLRFRSEAVASAVTSGMCSGGSCRSWLALTASATVWAVASGINTGCYLGLLARVDDGWSWLMSKILLRVGMVGCYFGLFARGHDMASWVNITQQSWVAVNKHMSSEWCIGTMADSGWWCWIDGGWWPIMVNRWLNDDGWRFNDDLAVVSSEHLGSQGLHGG